MNPPSIPPHQLPFVRRLYGVDYCALCDLALAYCCCGAAPADEPTLDLDNIVLPPKVKELLRQRAAGGR